MRFPSVKRKDVNEKDKNKNENENKNVNDNEKRSQGMHCFVTFPCVPGCD